eukprot:INCI17632.5.p1 GENE.INCI17632.5~~INCI17632.5.p1  ORF type:complete len:1327 (+),score=239.70 INCI17632.5:129-4109(+)
MGNQASAAALAELNAPTKSRPPRGSIAYRKLQKKKRRAQAESEAFNAEEDACLQRLLTALQSLDAESSGGLGWVECEDLKNLVLAGGEIPVVEANRANPPPFRSAASRRHPQRRGASTRARSGEAKVRQQPAASPGVVKVPRQLFRDEKAENTVLRAHNRTLIGEVRRLRAVLFTMNIAINRAARPKMEVLLHELRQRRAGTFPRGESVARKSLVRRQTERTLARRLGMAAAKSRGKAPASSSARAANASSRLNGNAGAESIGPGWGSGIHAAHLPFQQQVGVLLHRDFLQLLAAGHRTHSASSTAAASAGALKRNPIRSPPGSMAGGASAVGGTRPPLGTIALRTSSTKVVSAASLKLDRHSYTRWPLKCGRFAAHPVTARIVRLLMADATRDRFNIQLLHPTVRLLTPDLQLFLHKQVHCPLVSEFLSLRTALELAYSGLLQQSHVFACCSALGQLARAITLANDQSFSAWRSPPPFGGIGNPDGPGSPTFRGVGTLTWSQRIQVLLQREGFAKFFRHSQSFLADKVREWCREGGGLDTIDLDPLCIPVEPVPERPLRGAGKKASKPGDVEIPPAGAPNDNAFNETVLRALEAGNCEYSGVDGLDDNDASDLGDSTIDLVPAVAKIRARSVFALRRTLDLLLHDHDVVVHTMRATLDPAEACGTDMRNNSDFDSTGSSSGYRCVEVQFCFAPSDALRLSIGRFWKTSGATAGHTEDHLEKLMELYCAQPVKLVLELEVFHRMAEGLLKSNGHLSSVGSWLLLDEPLSSQISSAMELCAAREFVRVDDARPPSPTSTPTTDSRDPPIFDPHHSRRARVNNGDDDDDNDDDNVGDDSDDDDDDDDEDSLFDDNGGVGAAVQKPARPVGGDVAQKNSPPRFYDGLCNGHSFESVHRTVSRLALFRQSRKPHNPFVRLETDSETVSTSETRGDQLEADLSDIQGGLTQAIHIDHVDVTKVRAKALASALQMNGDLLRHGKQYSAAAGRGTVRSLTFRKCHGLGDDACAAIGSALAGIQCVRHLALLDCRHLNSRGAARLLRGCKFLRSLKVSNCNRLVGGAALKTSLPKYCGQLVRIHFDRLLQLNDTAVAVVIQRSPNLVELSVTRCPKITDAVLAVLAGRLPEYMAELLASGRSEADSAIWQLLRRSQRPRSASETSQCKDSKTKKPVRDFEDFVNNIEPPVVLQSPDAAALASKHGSGGSPNGGAASDGSDTDEDDHDDQPQCRWLRKLDFSFCQHVSDAGLHLAAEACSALEILRLESCDQITDDGLSSLVHKCPYLREINVSCCWRITDVSVAVIAEKCRYLQVSLNHLSSCISRAGYRTRLP